MRLIWARVAEILAGAFAGIVEKFSKKSAVEPHPLETKVVALEAALEHLNQRFDCLNSKASAALTVADSSRAETSEKVDALAKRISKLEVPAAKKTLAKKGAK
jgi:hypothetical protein